MSQAEPTGACPTCGTNATRSNPVPVSSYVYAIGTIEPRIPRLSVEKELAQVLRQADTEGLTERQALRRVLEDRQNRYLARQMCWVMSIGGLDTYIVTPRDPLDLDRLVETLRPERGPLDFDMVIGQLGPPAPPDLCNGLTIPMIALDVIYSFDRKSLVETIPQPEGVTAADFSAAAEELFTRIIQLTDNAGASDEHRAENYLLVRYPGIYAKAAEEFAAGASLTAVGAKSSALSGTRRVVDVIFAYTNRSTNAAEKYAVRVDVTEEFPFLVTQLSPYLDHIR